MQFLIIRPPSKPLKTLKLIQNPAACVLTRTRKRDHISPILASLHWLPVKSRIEFKILLITYKAFNDQALSYLEEAIVPYYSTRMLRSKNAGLLVVTICTSASPFIHSLTPPRPHSTLPLAIRTDHTHLLLTCRSLAPPLFSLLFPHTLTARLRLHTHCSVIKQFVSSTHSSDTV